MQRNTAISFEVFMQHALHDPKHGYYAKHIQKIGSRGDFTTAPMLSQAPAKAIANWATKALRESGCHDLIEIGPGNGTLAAAVWKNLPWQVRLRCRLHLVETSEPLRNQQQALLGKKPIWHQKPEDALACCDGHAVLFSNELVDAFPVRRYQKTPAGWQEIAVSFDDRAAATEWLLPLGFVPDSSSFSNHHPMGQKIEVHQSYHCWLQAWMPKWKCGRFLTIDYGAEAESLYQRRPHGTVRAYFLQQRIEGPAIYENIGYQDLTADVNFTDLIQWTRNWTHAYALTRFSDFLAEFTHGNDVSLIDPHGAGSAFLVLDQVRE